MPNPPAFTVVGSIWETNEVVYQCSECGVLVVDLGLMQAHALTHTWPDEQADCPYCGQRFFAPPGRDPLKKHFDWCVAYPDQGEIDVR